jgi:hypothetical protein
MLRWIATGLCVLVVVGAAVVHGASTHRWSMLNPSPARAEAMHAHTIAHGDYTSVDVPSEMPVWERSIVTCRNYTSPSGLPPIAVSMTSGPAGAVSTHTPDVCYPGSGYKTVKAPRKETIELADGTKATYLVADFERRTSSSYVRQRVRWAWSTGAAWDAPANPRFAYLQQTELFKLYIVTAHATELSDRPDNDSPAVKEFVTATFNQYGTIVKKK